MRPLRPERENRPQRRVPPENHSWLPSVHSERNQECHGIRKNRHKCKGLGDDRIVDKTKRSISDTKNTKILLKSDGEPALLQVQDRVISVRTQPTIPQNPPA